jgi:hypothetical protein
VGEEDQERGVIERDVGERVRVRITKRRETKRW